eukprot:m.189409 g.189409  ORF g.189409 m.189409 type:complete len:455 (+) comp21672_c0_seq4:984-2348(+)
MSEERTPLLAEGNVQTQDPAHIVVHDKNKTSEGETLVNFLKGCVASGVLALPFAFQNAGYVLGTIGMVLIIGIATYCLSLLILTKQTLCKQYNVDTMSYSEVGHFTVGKVGNYLITSALLVTQLGFCCVYVLFISVHLNEVWPQVTRLEYVAITLPVFVVLSWVRSLKRIAPTSMFANLLILFSLLAILAHCIQSMTNHETIYMDGHDCKEVIPVMNGTIATNQTRTIDVACKAESAMAFADVGSVPIFFGNAVYSVEIIGLVLPMENSMARPSRVNRVLYVGMAIVAVVYVLFGLLGYLVYGSATQGTVSENMPDNVLFNVVKICLCVALVQTYTIQLYPAVNIIEKAYAPKINHLSPSQHRVVQTVVRSLIALLTVGLAAAIPHLGLFISLVGSLGAGALALVFPPLMHYQLFRDSLNTAQRVRAYVLILFGVLGSVAGTFVSIKDIVNAMT